MNNHPNNARLRELIEAAGLTQAVAMTLFNRGRSAPATETVFKSWLADVAGGRWQALSDADREHAEQAFGMPAKRGLDWAVRGDRVRTTSNAPLVAHADAHHGSDGPA